MSRAYAAAAVGAIVAAIWLPESRWQAIGSAVVLAVAAVAAREDHEDLTYRGGE